MWDEEINGMGLIHYLAEGSNWESGWYWQRDTDWATSVLYPTRAAAIAARREHRIEWEAK